MKIYVTVIFVLSCVFGVLLHVLFRYPLSIAGFHIISVCILLLLTTLIVAITRLVIKNKQAAFTFSNVIAFFPWMLIYLLYPVILGSNAFWGSTITFDILKKYLVSFNSILTILPVEKWILVSGLVLYLAVGLALFYAIRIRRSHFENPPMQHVRRRYLLAAALFAAGAIFLLRHPLVELKRSMHFAKEPLIYFALGPMWQEERDLIFDTDRAKLGALDKPCIDSIRPAADKSKTVMIILLDALRSDHLPMYGYKRNTSPFMDSLYQSGKMLRVKNAYSTATNTIGGIGGLFYSRDWDKFSFSGLSLMKYFRLSGYSTYAFLTGYHSGWYGLSNMYREDCDYFYESTSGGYQSIIDDDLITLEKIKSTDLNPGSFIFIHLLSTHLVGKKHKDLKSYFPDKLDFSTNKDTTLINNYDNGVKQGDYVIREIFSKLREENLLDNITLYIVGDHGELFGEDGHYSHGADLHQNVLEVPILVYDNDLSWYKNTNIATLMDVAPSITSKTFGKIPGCWQGRSLELPLQPFTTKLTSATAKVDYPSGTLRFRNDSLQMDIFDSKGNLFQSLYKDSVWKRIYP